jgi:TPR repeat protein
MTHRPGVNITKETATALGLLFLADREANKALVDPSRAAIGRNWLERAASSGNTKAQYEFGIALAQGRFGAADPTSAKAMLLKAKSAGHPQAGAAIERCH